MSYKVCLWNHCSLNIRELPVHLSREHIGWKRAEYKCLWDGCHRRNIKWYSRFSLISHLRLHTGESPFECQRCHKTFSNMEGLERHGKIEHIDQQVEKKVPSSIKKKRKLAELQHRYNDYLSDDSDAADQQLDLPLILQEHSHHRNSKHDLIPKLSTKKQKSNKSTAGAGATTEKDGIKDQYKLAKAQLNYILRENEMLCDEWANTEKKLKRLRTERRVLLDALVKRGYNNEEME